MALWVAVAVALSVAPTTRHPTQAEIADLLHVSERNARVAEEVRDHRTPTVFVAQAARPPPGDATGQNTAVYET